MTASDEIWNRLARAGLDGGVFEASADRRAEERRKWHRCSRPNGRRRSSRTWTTAGERSPVRFGGGNREYEQRFGRVFIVCATGKSAPEMLEILQRRLRNDDATELHEAAEEQRKITNIRLKKWLHR